MDILPYDIHEHILNLIENKIDKFAYVDAYNNVEMWKFYALSLTTGIKNRYNIPRVVEDPLNDVRIYIDCCKKGFMFCCCGKKLKVDYHEPEHSLRYRIKMHKKSGFHNKHLDNPVKIDYQLLGKCKYRKTGYYPY